MNHGENATTVSVECRTLGEVAEKLAACAALGLRDVTLTSVPQAAVNHLPAGWKYLLDARGSNAAILSALAGVAS